MITSDREFSRKTTWTMKETCYKNYNSKKKNWRNLLNFSYMLFYYPPIFWNENRKKSTESTSNSSCKKRSWKEGKLFQSYPISWIWKKGNHRKMGPKLAPFFDFSVARVHRAKPNSLHHNITKMKLQNRPGAHLFKYLYELSFFDFHFFALFRYLPVGVNLIVKEINLKDYIYWFG